MFHQSSRNLDTQEIKSKAIDRKRSQLSKAESFNSLNSENDESDDQVFLFVPEIVFRKDDIQNRTVCKLYFDPPNLIVTVVFSVQVQTEYFPKNIRIFR